MKEFGNDIIIDKNFTCFFSDDKVFLIPTFNENKPIKVYFDEIEETEEGICITKKISIEEAIRKVGQIFLDNGFVKDTYIDAVVAREKVYPTGLQLADMGVAMPHTDPPHVYKSGVCVAKLAKPVTFIHMGTEDQPVEAEMLFMMAITDPSQHLETLSKVMNVFQKPEIAKEFKDATTNEELYKVAYKHIGLED